MNKKINNIVIKPLEKINKPPRQINEPLPCSISNQPFVWIISAKIGSGKSVCLSNILNMYKRYFKRVYFCSSNVDYNEQGEKIINDLAYKTDKLIFSKERLFDEFDDYILHEILDDINKTKKREDYDEETDHFLIVVDDLSQAFTKTKSFITKTILRTRHIKLSWIIVTQRYRNIAPVIRNQANYFITFFTSNQKELDSMSETIDMSFDEFKKLIDQNLTEKHDFLFFDCSQNPCKIYKNFNTLIR